MDEELRQLTEGPIYGATYLRTIRTLGKYLMPCAKTALVDQVLLVVYLYFTYTWILGPRGVAKRCC